MKLGDVKAEALKLMFLNLDEDITANSIATLMYDETYASYLVAMPGSIQRGLTRAATAHRIGEKSVVLENGTEKGRWMRYDLKIIVPDLLKIKSIVEDRNGYIRGVYDYQLEGKTLILPTLYRDTDEYRLIYWPKAPDVKGLNDLVDKVDVPEEVEQILPYFVKGELFEEDDPGAAAQARNIFEAWLSELPEEEGNHEIELIF